MAVIEWKKDGTVAIITMNTDENRHNPDFAKGFLNVFDEIESDQEIASVVIASSSEKNWSLGIDLMWITGAMNNQELDSIRQFMYDMNNVFKKIMTLPMPVIGAMNGHTFGNGSILACCCDYRFMKADRGYFCFPEVDINIPFLPSMLETMKKSIPYYKLEELVFSGKRIGAKEMEEHHIIVKACDDAESLMKETMEFARTYTKGRRIFEQHKVRLHKHILEVMEKEDPEFIEPLNLMV
ncbi:MAG TPA: enoyl-CoA hydratase/isomerase family protein [Deltaproteobacteria bacterium]|nr:enoyl-CoA hydratase/isomerase family protein [Deltaproteobacteria bacterium]HPJ95124.1 enoyl-CoA hydratase/isomerase family protein [Deltaproteobacteria bacterium]HPR52946.1 enoyl-CoA hydratase/isomerase family protein [Deltaproteobacteria bacterium]